MTNIPTELLRALIAVVDQRSFTKAAQSLGVTQPAVSAQIKRLQWLLGADLLDKRAPGVSLTSAGEIVVDYARRLLSINDQILDLASPCPLAQTLRIGMTGDFAASAVAPALARFRERRPEIRFVFRCRTLEILVAELRDGDLDLVVGLSAAGPAPDSHRHWRDEVVWVRGETAKLDLSGAVPLVSYGEDCALHRAAIAALNHAGRDAELVFVGSTVASLVAAVVAGIGVTVLPPNHAGWPHTVICDDTVLPKPPQVFCGLYLRDGAGRSLREELADAIEAAIRPDHRPAPTGRIAARSSALGGIPDLTEV